MERRTGRLAVKQAIGMDNTMRSPADGRIWAKLTPNTVVAGRQFSRQADSTIASSTKMELSVAARPFVRSSACYPVRDSNGTENRNRKARKFAILCVSNWYCILDVKKSKVKVMRWHNAGCNVLVSHRRIQVSIAVFLTLLAFSRFRWNFKKL